jgi:hypothetical protein
MKLKQEDDANALVNGVLADPVNRGVRATNSASGVSITIRSISP